MAQRERTSVAILGVAVDNLSMDEVLDTTEAWIEEGGFHQVATANVDFLIRSIHDAELKETLCRCDLVVADGMPLVWASQLLGAKLKERVTGADLVPRIAELSERRGYRIFMLGASEESSAGAAAWMKRNHPGVVVAGRYSPKYQALEEMDHEDILARIEAARPDILLVAFGNPKQEKWLAMHRHRLKVPVCIGVGATFDFLSGRMSRAPRWMQSCSLEWLYRTSQEPRRLAQRYASNATGLARYLTLQLAATAVQTKRRTMAQLRKEKIASTIVIHVQGNFTGAMVPRLEEEAYSAVLAHSHLVLNLSETLYVGPDALGSLIHILKLAQRWKREFWLTGVQRNLWWVLRAAQLGSAFRVAPKLAEALRRIEPEPVTASGADWSLLRIGGQAIPIHSQEVPELYLQAVQMLRKIRPAETVPVAALAERMSDSRLDELFTVAG